MPTANFAPTLTSLCLDECNLDDEAMTCLFEAGGFRQLRDWALWGNRPGEQAFRALARNTAFAALESLSLGYSELTPTLAGNLGETGTLPQLRSLSLCDPLTATALRNLLAGPLLRSVHFLDLDSCRIDDAGARVLATSRVLSGLRSLSLRYNAITDKGARALVQSDALAGLRNLSLDDNALTEAGKASVRARFGEANCLD
jgi:hypothetical protein